MAFFVSIAFGLVIGVLALAIGVLLIAKRNGKTLPLVLGIVLAVLAFMVVLATAVTSITVYTIGEAVEEATKTNYATGELGKPITVGKWEITVLNVKETKFLKSGGTYYSAEDGRKAVIVTTRIKNTGVEASSVSDVWNFILVTNVNKSYEKVWPIHFNIIWSVSEDVKRSAVEVKDLGAFQSVAPGTYIEGDLLFDIPRDEKPKSLFFQVGIIGPTQVEVRLSK